jgi:hypothetical protein
MWVVDAIVNQNKKSHGAKYDESTGKKRTPKAEALVEQTTDSAYIL